MTLTRTLLRVVALLVTGLMLVGCPTTPDHQNGDGHEHDDTHGH